MKVISNRRQKTLPFVLNKIKLYNDSEPMSGVNLPIGLTEDISNTLSALALPLSEATFEEARCFRGNGGIYATKSPKTNNLYDLDSYFVEIWMYDNAPTATESRYLFSHRQESSQQFTVAFRRDVGDVLNLRLTISDGAVKANLNIPLNDDNTLHKYGFKLSNISTSTPLVEMFKDDALIDSTTYSKGASIISSICTLFATTINAGGSFINPLHSTRVLDIKEYSDEVLTRHYPLVESGIIAGSSYYNVTENDGHATVSNVVGIYRATRPFGDYGQLGRLQNDGGLQTIPILSDLSAFADGSALDSANAVVQNGYRFLQNGSRIKAIVKPSLLIAESVNRFWTDEFDAALNLTFTAFVGNYLNQTFNYTGTLFISDIRTHYTDLSGRQLKTEDRIRTENGTPPVTPPPEEPTEIDTLDISLFTNELYNFTGNIQKNTINNKYSSVYDQGVSHYSLGDLHNVLVDVYTDAFSTLEASRVAMAADAVNDYSFTNPSSGYTSTGRLVVIATKVDHSSNYQPIGLVVRYSDNDGVSWSSEYTIPGITVYTALNTNSNIIEQSGSLYCPYYEADRLGSGIVNLKCMRSDDNGATWAIIGTIDTSTWTVAGEPINETSMMFLDTTTILAMTRVNGKSYYNQYISFDSGLNWTKQGNTSFGDTWPDNGTNSTYVHLIRLGKFNLNGKTVIASYYFNRYEGVVNGDAPFYVTYGLASNFTGQGVNAWLSDERKEIVTTGNPYSNLDGYPAVLHDNNDVNAAIRIFDDRDNGSQNKTDIRYVRMDMQDTQWLDDILV